MIVYALTRCATVPPVPCKQCKQ